MKIINHANCVKLLNSFYERSKVSLLPLPQPFPRYLILTGRSLFKSRSCLCAKELVRGLYDLGQNG